MIFWTRMGILVYVFIIVCNLLMALAVDTVFGNGYYAKHAWAIGLGTIIGGVLSSGVGFAIRPRGRGRKVIDAKTGKKFVIKEPDHTFMFIPMHWAGLVVAGIGLLFVIAGPFLPPPKGKRGAAAAAPAIPLPQVAAEQKFPPLRGQPGGAPPGAVVPIPSPPFATRRNPGAPFAAPPAVVPPAVADASGREPQQPEAPVAEIPEADVPAAEPRVAEIPRPADRAAVRQRARDKVPAGTRALEENEKPEIGTRVVAGRGASWEAGLIDSVGATTAHVDFLRLGDGFNDDFEYDQIRIPLTKEEIDPALLTTIKFEMFRGVNLTSKDLPQLEEALLKLEGYVPETVALNQKARQMSFVVVKESFAERFPGHIFLETKLPHGRRLKE